MKNQNKKRIPLFLLNNNKGLSSEKPNFFRPLSFKNIKNNTISNPYNNSLKKNLTNKIISLSLKNVKKTIDSLQNSNDNINSLNSCNSLSPYSFSSILQSKKNINKINEKLSLTIGQKNELNSIIKNFQDNKITTMELYKIDKNCPLNSITRSNFRFLTKENIKHSKKKSKIKQKMNKVLLTSSNMIELFNVKTRKILDNSIKNLKFSKNINEFRKQIINSYSDYDKKLNDIKKKNLYNNEVLNIFEEYDEKGIKNVEKLEKNFYKTKSKTFLHRKPIYLYNKNIYNSMSKNKIDTDNNLENEVDPFQKYFNNKYIYNSSKNNNNIFNKRLKNVQSEKKFTERKKNFENYIKNKLKNKAKIFADSIYDINDFPSKEFPSKILRKKNVFNYLNLNINNLRRIVKVNSIKKNSYSIEDDDLLIKNTKKLREEIRKTENNFYSVFKGKGNYKLNFLKEKVKPSTLQKLKNIENSHFCLP